MDCEVRVSRVQGEGKYHTSRLTLEEKRFVELVCDSTTSIAPTRIMISKDSIKSISTRHVDEGKATILFNDKLTEGVKELNIQKAKPTMLQDLVLKLKELVPFTLSHKLMSKSFHGSRMLAATKVTPTRNTSGYSHSLISDVTRKQRSIFTTESPSKRLKIDTSFHKGFVNLGNTCYINAVLKSLLGIKCFIFDITRADHVSKDSLCYMLQLLSTQRKESDYISSSRVLLSKICYIICRRGRTFSGFNEQDAHELLTQCLEIIKNDFAINKLEFTCPVYNNFNIFIQQTVTCKKCRHETLTTQQMTDISLPLITYNNNLQHLLNIYFKNEDVVYTCVNCQFNWCTISREFCGLPRVLILTIKRYDHKNNICTKRTDPVHIPQYIDIKSLCSDNVSQPTYPHNESQLPSSIMTFDYNESNEDQQLQKALELSLRESDEFEQPAIEEKDVTEGSYRLCSVISHIGSAISTGHYISEVDYFQTNNWWMYSDTVVIPTDQIHVRRCRRTTAYILFYIHTKK